MSGTNLENRFYYAYWMLLLCLALVVLYHLQGSYKDLFVSDQFYYFELMEETYARIFENVDKRYYTFAIFLKVSHSLVGDPYLVYLFYVVLNGLLLMFACRNFRIIHIVFFSLSFLYLSHGLLRDQLILSFAALLARSWKILIEIVLLSLRVQLILLIPYQNKLLNYLVPSLIFAYLVWWLNIHLSEVHLVNAIQSIYSLPGVGFLTVNKEFPLIYTLMRMLLGFVVFAYWVYYLLTHRGSFATGYKLLLVLLTYSTIGIPVDIRVFVIATAVVIGYVERRRLE
jgi:hypothetical protein